MLHLLLLLLLEPMMSHCQHAPGGYAADLHVL